MNTEDLLNAIKSIIINDHAPTHHNNGNSNRGGSDTGISPMDDPFGNNEQEVLVSEAGAARLYQNIPGPYGGGGTKINYYLTMGTMGAYIVFYDMYGNRLKSVPLAHTGNGTLNVTPDILAAGIYSYSLVVNNKVVDSKRMILQK